MYDVRVSPIFIQILLYAMVVVVCIMWVLALFYLNFVICNGCCDMWVVALFLSKFYFL
jgi:hypothetical protein